MMCFSAKEVRQENWIGGGTGGAILRAHTKKIFHKKSLEGKVPRMLWKRTIMFGIMAAVPLTCCVFTYRVHASIHKKVPDESPEAAVVLP